MSRSATTRQAIIDELAESGPMTYLELAEALGMPRYSIADAVQYSRRNHGNAHFRVERWSLGPSGPVAHWGLGPKKDAPKPAARTPSRSESSTASGTPAAAAPRRRRPAGSIP